MPFVCFQCYARKVKHFVSFCEYVYFIYEYVVEYCLGGICMCVLVTTGVHRCLCVSEDYFQWLIVWCELCKGIEM